MTTPREALKCTKCGRTNVDFPKNAEKSGRRKYCVECDRKYYVEYREKNRPEYARRMREWRKKHGEVYKEKSRRRGKILYSENPEHYREKAIRLRKKLKDTVYEAYGGYKCACCGETTPEFLTIDHINNDGAEHRKSIGKCGNNLLCWLKKENYPVGFQILSNVIRDALVVQFTVVFVDGTLNKL